MSQSQRGASRFNRKTNRRDARVHAVCEPLEQRLQLTTVSLAMSAVEVSAAVDRPDDLVECHDLQARRALADEAERLDHLFVGQYDPDVVGFAAQARNQLGDPRAAARAHEIVLRIDAGEPGGARSRHAGLRLAAVVHLRRALG